MDLANLPERIYPKAKIALWKSVYEGRPPWEYVKRSGLYGRGERRIFSLGCGRVLCDSLSALIFANQVDITVNDSAVNDYVRKTLDDNAFWEIMPSFLSRAFGLGGGALRCYISSGKVCMDFAGAQQFVPLDAERGRICDGVFISDHRREGEKYRLYERQHTEGGDLVIEREMFDVNGREVSVDIAGLKAEERFHGCGTCFAYLRPVMPDPTGPTLCGVSVLDTCMDTLKALDTVFDSFVREFILGRKRIIVPSSCIRTVVDPDTGKISRYFDADDEVYQALKCDEERDLKIIDNTTELRVEEHTEAINTLLDLLCFQSGLSAGTLSFSQNGVKTAAEIRSMQNRTDMTMQQYRAVCAEFLECAVKAVIACGIICGDIKRGDYGVRISFTDTQVTDTDTVINRNIALVNAGLRSECSAVMNINDCTEEEAERELKKVRRIE